MTIDDLPALGAELEGMLVAERELPPVPAGLEQRLRARLAATLGWGAGGAGGALLLLKFLLVVAAAAGVLAVGWVATHRGDGGRPDTGQSAAAPSVRRDAAPAPIDERTAPAWFGEPDRPEAAIAGRVLGSDGQLVVGARVVLTNELTRAGVLPEIETVTDGRGAFAFGAHRAGIYDVTAAAAGQGEGHVRVTTLDPTERPRPDDVTVVLPGCASALYGVVHDASGGVIAGAELSRTRGTWGTLSPIGISVVTDENGAYQLCTPPGPLAAIVRADGYGTMTVLDTVIGRRQLDIELMPAASVIGRVVRADDGRPVAGARVSLRPQAFPLRLRATPDSAVSDADGRFRFGGVAPGRHTVFATTGDTLTTPPVPVVLDPGQEVAIVVTVSDLEVHIDGRIVENGQPVAGAKVFAVLDGKRQGGGWPPSDADGRFRIRMPHPVTIGFALDTHDVLSPKEYDAPAGRSSVVLEVSSRGAIRGVVELGGKPVAGAEVKAMSSALERTVEAVTDLAGRFELRGLPGGHYALYAQSYDVQAFNSKEVTVELGARETRDGVVIELDGAASIAGTVVDQDGAPVSSVAVHWSDAVTGDLCDATTTTDGAFTCVMISGGGDYVPVVRLDQFSASALPAATADGLAAVQVADGNTRITGVVLHVRVARGTIRGRVVDRGGAPYPDVTVRAIEESSGYTAEAAARTGSRAATTDADGRFSLAVWSDARYTVHARAPGGAEASATGVTAGGPEPVIRLGRPGRIVGTLVGFSARPRVVARRLEETGDLYDAALDGDHFVVDGLTAGRYGVEAIGGAQGAAVAVDVHDGSDTAIEVEARPTTRLTGRVVDFVSGRPIDGVRCVIAPYVVGAGVTQWGTVAPPTDGDGRFVVEAPSGEVEVLCASRPWRNSDGLVRVVAGDTADVSIPVVIGEKDDYGGNGIGVRIGFAHAPLTGYILPIVELRPGGTADKAGLRVGDIVTAVDGRDVTVLINGALLRLIGLHPVGDPVRVTVHRGAATTTIAVPAEGPWWP